MSNLLLETLRDEINLDRSHSAMIDRDLR